MLPSLKELTVKRPIIQQNYILCHSVQPLILMFVFQLSALAEQVHNSWAAKEPEDYTCYDLVALQHILCGFNRTIIEKIHPSAYR